MILVDWGNNKNIEVAIFRVRCNIATETGSIKRMTMGRFHVIFMCAMAVSGVLGADTQPNVKEPLAEFFKIEASHWYCLKGILR